MAELKQALLSRLAGGVGGVNAAATITGAARDIDDRLYARWQELQALQG